MGFLNKLPIVATLVPIFSLCDVSIASEPTNKPRAVRTIPWGRDGKPVQDAEQSPQTVEKGARRVHARPLADLTSDLATPPIPTPRPPLSDVSVLDGDWCVPENACIGPEPITREGFSTCEEFCSLSNPMSVPGFDATVFDVSCKGEGDSWGDYRMMLAEYEDYDGTRRATMLTPNGVENLVRCSDDPAPQPDQSVSQCDFNSRLYRAKPGNPDVSDQYHELQFVDGFTSGTATITEYREGKPIWRATGEHACSNGAVICRLLFPMTSGEVAEAPFEVLPGEDGDYTTIVAPSFSQNVYLSERNATMNGKSYGGLKADLLNGFTPDEHDLLLPRNVYKFAGCTQ